AAEPAAVDVSVPVTMLKGNLPLPAGIARGHESVRIGRRGTLAVHDHRPIAGKPLTPILVARPEGSLDEQPLKAAAVEEKIRADALACLQSHRLDESIRAADRHVADVTFGALHAPRLGIATQIAREAPGIEVQGIG